MRLSHRKELILIIFMFLAPIFIASYLYIGFVKNDLHIEPKSYGYLFQPGERVDLSFDKRWTLIHFTDPSSQRYLMWCEQVDKIKVMLGLLADQVSFIEMDGREQQLSSSWDYSLEQGGFLLVDNNGYIALGYRYEQEPKKTFIELKKIIKATV